MACVAGGISLAKVALAAEPLARGLRLSSLHARDSRVILPVIHHGLRPRGASGSAAKAPFAKEIPPATQASFTGIKFWSLYSILVNVRLCFQCYMWVSKGFEKIRHHFTCKT